MTRSIPSSVGWRVVPAFVVGLLLVAAASPAQAAGPGIHGRVFALDEQGRMTGTLSGATIELKGASGAVAGRATSGPGGYYKIDVAPGQYLYKVQAPGFKDEDHARGIALELADGYAVYNFSLTKGPNDPQRKPPQVVPVETGRLQGRVLEKTPRGLLGIPHATVALRRTQGGRQMTRVVTRGEDRTGKATGYYEVVLEAGEWRASVSADGFETFVDPKQIAILPGKVETRDFVLTRSKPPEPTDQGIRGVVTVYDPSQRTSVPPDVRLTIVPVGDPRGGPEFSPDGKGAYQQALMVGRYTVAARAKGYRPARSRPASVLVGKYTLVNLMLVPLEKPDRPAIDLVLVATVYERLPRGKGARPLRGASVLARKQGQALADASRGTADEKGQVTLKVRGAGDYAALATMPGYKSAGVRVAVSPTGKNLAELFLERALDTTQTPDTTVPLPTPTPTPGETTPLPLPRPTPGEMPGTLVKVGGYVVYRDPKSPSGYFGVTNTDMLWQRMDGPAKLRRQSVAGELGRYGVELPEGSYVVELRPPQGFQSKREQVTVRRGMDALFFVLARVSVATPLPIPGTTEPLPSQIGVRGRVVTRSAKSQGGYEGVAGAEVAWLRGGSPREAERTMSGKGGDFSLSLRDGWYEVVVKAPRGFKGTTQKIEVRQGMRPPMLIVARIDSTPERGPTDSTLPGTIQPIPGFIKPLPGLPGDRSQSPGQDTDKPSAKQTLSVLVVERVTAGKGKLSTLPKLPQGRPIAGAAITIKQGGRTIASGRTDQGGRYSVSLPAGSYDISVTQQGFGPARDAATISRASVTREITLVRQGGATTAPF